MTSRLSHSPASLQSPRRARHRFRIAALATVALVGTLLSVQMSLAHSGRYAVKDDDLMLRIENSTFPTWEGTEQKQDLTLIRDRSKPAAAIPSLERSTVTAAPIHTG